MSKGNSSTQSGGIGFLGLLTIVFIVLKLTHYIDWSWWWVTFPLWGGFAIAFAAFGIVLIVALIVAALE